MKTIGVLGGIGPQATMDFEARVHRESQRRIPPRMGCGYPPMFVHYHRRPPFVLNDDGLARMPIEPDPDLLRAASRLGAVADFLVITSNGRAPDPGRGSSGRRKEVLSMIDVTLDEVRRRGWTRVGVIGLGDPIVYTRRLDALGTRLRDPGARGSGARRRRDLPAHGRPRGRRGSRLAREAVERLRGRGVEGVILGCTELPLLLREHGEGPDLLNPAPAPRRGGRPARARVAAEPETIRAGRAFRLRGSTLGRRGARPLV